LTDAESDITCDRDCYGNAHIKGEVGWLAGRGMLVQAERDDENGPHCADGEHQRTEEKIA
jgi:hypothetical protein